MGARGRGGSYSASGSWRRLAEAERDVTQVAVSPLRRLEPAAEPFETPVRVIAPDIPDSGRTIVHVGLDLKEVGEIARRAPRSAQPGVRILAAQVGLDR
jgi:hypothetical protein